MNGGALLVVGFEGTALTPEERRVLERVRPGGLVLFARNLQEVDETRALVGALRRLLPEAILCVDQEGGRVDRLRRLVGPAPAPADLAGRRVSRSLRAGRTVGEALRHFGFDLDFAPVLDLDHGRVDNALDRRCFGRDPRSVVARAGAFLEGLSEVGILNCLKHFPGLGGATQDTHHAGSAIDLPATELERDLSPFIRLAPVADAIMVSHASYPGWDPSRQPATLSPAVATDLLRRRLGFDGIAFTDDLEMQALGGWLEIAERAEAALIAGCDGLLVCRRLEETPGIAERLEAARFESRRLEAAARWERLRAALSARRKRVEGRKPLSLETVRLRLARLATSVPQNGMSSSPGGK